MNQKQFAKDFKALHDEFFILPNVWNAGSARIFQEKGFKAIATTSAGIAFSLGYPDGEIISIDELIQVIKQINRRITIPLSVDIERGYSNNTNEIVNNVRKIINAGTVGINIEDGRPDNKLDDLDLQIEKIKAIVSLKEELDIPFVINARTCAYWLNVEGDKLKIAIKRANAFAEAGADCIFIPGNLTLDEMVTLTKNISLPINIVLSPVYYDLNEIKKIGIKRLSIGSAAAQCLLGNLIDIATELNENNVNTLLNRTLNYNKANKIFRIINSV